VAGVGGELGCGAAINITVMKAVLVKEEEEEAG